ncbi:MAG: ltaE 1 [Actinomycetia bacterium]|nr:ltaE 1 [Actinomycetes bacterium]
MSALATLPPPERSFASDNTAGAHPDVVAAVVAANTGHVAPYGEDPLTESVAARFADLFGRPVEVALAFGGTGANVVALHTVTSRDSLVVCSADAHIVLDEAGAPEHITGAQLVGYPWSADGKLTAADVADTVARLGRIHIHDVTATRHVVSVTQATEVGTVYRPDELAAICDEAHRHGMVVHVDGARLANALVAWGHGPDDLGGACRRLADCGVDVVVFGGTKAGMFGAEAVVFCEPALAECVAMRRKQATQTASKMRFLAAQYAAALEGGRILAWAASANAAAARLATRLGALPGVALAYPVETNAVFCRLPAGAVAPLLAWTPCYEWDPATNLVRFVASWDTTDEDVDRLVAGVESVL